MGNPPPGRFPPSVILGVSGSLSPPFPVKISGLGGGPVGMRVACLLHLHSAFCAFGACMHCAAVGSRQFDRVRNTDGTNPLAPATPNPACFVQRVQVFANGQRCDDINYYGRTVAVHDLLKGREYNRNKAMPPFSSWIGYLPSFFCARLTHVFGTAFQGSYGTHWRMSPSPRDRRTGSCWS